MSENMIPFKFEGAEVRVVDQDGEPWWVLADVCKVLELRNPTITGEKLDDDEKAKLNLGSGSPATIINESGLYSIILTSRKSKAKSFKKWITAEVIPSIRKTGGYMVAAPDETPEQIMARAVLVAQDTIERQKAQIAVVQPKADAYDRIAGTDGSLNVTEAAKALQVNPKDLFDWLSNNGWIYKRRGSPNWLGYQSHTTNGDLEHKVTTVLRSDGSEKITEQVRVTPRGLAKLAKLMPGRMRMAA